MSKHTLEPWRLEPSPISFETSIVTDKHVIAIVKHYSDSKSDFKRGQRVDVCIDEGRANAARIVACVNACAGMEDPQAEIQRLKEKAKEAANG